MAALGLTVWVQRTQRWCCGEGSRSSSGQVGLVPVSLDSPDKLCVVPAYSCFCPCRTSTHSNIKQIWVWVPSLCTAGSFTPTDYPSWYSALILDEKSNLWYKSWYPVTYNGDLPGEIYWYNHGTHVMWITNLFFFKKMNLRPSLWDEIHAWHC